LDTHPVVLDASVFVADTVTTEPFHADANDLLEALAARGAEIYVPAIIVAEIAAAIARGSEDAPLARQAVTLYRQWPGVRVIPVDEPLGDLAAEVAAGQRVRGCDAVYVALAQSLGATLITLDRQQRERTPPGIAARSPGDALAELQRP